ncbi:MAG: 5'-nucleotidase C-terminal domain-containing protein [Selenomonadaceae bacterium]|nr:5'-nucleotidase C-terminal domain-containing protein [Selenomonadaceae bacterium]
MQKFFCSKGRDKFMSALKNLIGAVLIASIFLFTATVEATELVIWHTNDFHGRILDTDERGETTGIAWMISAIKNLKTQNPNSLWLDAGDIFHGMPVINVSNGKNMLDILNISQSPDAITLGNQDFDYGIDAIIGFSKNAKFDILDANVVYKKNNKPLLKPYNIYTLPNNLKVGVFGLATPETAYKTRPSLVADVNFLNPVDTAKKMVKELRSKCDVVIAVTHLGLEEDAEFPSSRIAKEVEGIDVIVDGHSHTLLQNGLTIGKTLIVQTGAYAYNLGKVTIDVERHKVVDKRAELINKNSIKEIARAEDKAVLKAIDEMNQRNKKFFDEVIGESSKFLSGERDLVRTQEMELGDFIADAFRWFGKSDIGVVNAGGIRGDIPVGKVTKGNMIAIFPFGNQLQVAEIKGSAIREMLNHSVSAYPETVGVFLQVSGIKFTFDPSLPAENRVVGEILINGQPLDDNKIYTIAAFDFLFEGGNNYNCFKDIKIIGKYGTGEEILEEYLKKVGTDKIETGRITIRSMDR